MPKFRIHAKETHYFLETIIEAENESEARAIFIEAEAQGIIDISDSDGIQFTKVTLTDQPVSFEHSDYAEIMVDDNELEFWDPGEERPKHDKS